MRRFVASVFALCIIVSSMYFGVNAMQTEDISASRTTFTNEYDMLSSLRNKNETELRSQGFSTKEIQAIYNLNDAYSDHLEQIAELDSGTLRKMGYNESQIKILRSFNGTENEIRALAATLSFTLSIDYVTWSETQNRTNARLCYYFSWAGVPLIKTTDAVALSWNDWIINGKLGNVTYVHINGLHDDQVLSATYVQNTGPTSYGGGFKFAMTREDNYYWAQSGYGIFTLYRNNARADLSAYGQYGHATVTLVPSFSIPGYGYIAFVNNVEIAGEDWVDMACSD